MVTRIALLSCLLFILCGCTTVPFTGRNQAALIPENQMVALGTQSYDQILQQYKISNNQQQTTLLRNVGYRLATAVESFAQDYDLKQELKLFQWQFNLLDAPKVINAFALPGGKVGVFTGILPITQNEEGLAVVVSHEVAHVIAKHGNERMSQQLMLQLGSIALSEVLKQDPVQTRQIFLAAYGVGTELAVVLPYSRTQETEADKIGLILMARAGYNPDSAVSFWERMKAEAGPNPPEFLSTHPAPETRIKDIQNFIPEAMKYYKAPTVNAS